MIRVARRPTDTEFVLFHDWQRRAALERIRLIKEWETDGRPTKWKPKIKADLYKEFREVFLYEAFHLKCAYCETKIGHDFATQVEHYRPKGGLTQDGSDTAHPGYFWLAYEWWNLVPTCNNCNTWHTDPLSGDRNQAKSTKFPIRGSRVFEPSDDPDRWQDELFCEKPLLLNPYLDKPEEHLDFDPTTGAPVPVTPQGTATILICDLNRMALCERRRSQGEDALYRMTLRLMDLEPIDSIIPSSAEFSLWRKCLLRRRLTTMCAAAGLSVTDSSNTPPGGVATDGSV